ncbi:MAG: chromosomal replication initiator protein DnaA [Deltaproteobacteria bacterium]|jgi:chromosomal replication initiator protein|nr:chromosomal replication initiator protein DnaA [Deltaproteobacteria bacterium]
MAQTSAQRQADSLWQTVTTRLRATLGPVEHATWIEPLTLVGVEQGTASVAAPNRFFRDWVSERYLKRLQEAFSTELGQATAVKLTLSKANTSANAQTEHGPQPSANPAPSVQHWQPRLNPRYTFAEFVVGSSNQFAHAAALAVANQPGEKYNPLFIYGGVGLGKTHLVTALGHQLLADAGRPRKVLFMPAEFFMNELISSLRRDRMTEFKEKFRRADALILDDVQFLAGRERTQEEFFHTFNSLHADRHQIVLTSDKVPRDIPDLEERLRNRFESGLIADVGAPDLETRVAIVQKKALAEGLEIPDDAILYIAQNVSSNVRELEGCLTRLAAFASVNHAPITLAFARQALHDLVRRQHTKPDVEQVQRAVAEFFHIRLSDLKSKRRTQHIAFCRQVAMYLCRKLTESSFPLIGAHFARDHSTVIHACNLIERRAANDPAFRQSIDKIERRLTSASQANP